MYLSFNANGTTTGWENMLSLLGESLMKRDGTSNGSITITELRSQWSNPSDVSTLLMIIGGDVVQGALAQSTGTWFTPVCFSFGWVSYAFIALLHVIGDGRLLPPADYPVKVINLKTGYARDNKNWVVGRLLRDGEAWVERRKPLNDNGIRISVFEAQKRRTGDSRTKFLFDRTHLYGLAVMVIQLVVASIPVIRNREWGVLFITGAGTLLAQIAGALPQWRAEKLPNRQHSKEIYALTTGNGSKDVMVIIGRGQCLDVEDFSVSDTPRSGRPWEKFETLSRPTLGPDGNPRLHRSGTQMRTTRVKLGLPYGFLVTRIVSVILSILWLLLLINVASVKDSTWYLVLVGAIGMFQNGFLASMERPPEARNIPLRHAETIATRKVMDGIMDFEIAYGFGRSLLSSYFPGDLRPDENDWWNGMPDAYDITREKAKDRGIPRRNFPRLNKASSDPERLKSDPKLNLDENPAPRWTSCPVLKEKTAPNPFSDAESSTMPDPISSSVRRSPLRLIAGWEITGTRSNGPQLGRTSGGSGSHVLSKQNSDTVSRTGQRTKAKRASPLSQYHSALTISPEDSEEREASSTQPPIQEAQKSPLSAEEVFDKTRPPDWVG